MNGDHTTALRLLPSLHRHNDIKCQHIYDGYAYLIHRAAANGWIDVLKLLTGQYNCDLLQRDSRGWTALHWAASAGQLEVVQYLINDGRLSIWDRTNNGHTPLHEAAWLGHLSVVVYLVECGSDVLAVDSSNATPLHIACQYNYNNGNLPVITYLLSIPAVLNSFVKYKHLVPDDTAAVCNKFEQVQISHPVGSFVNIFLLGNPGVGKTTLCQAIKERSSVHIKSQGVKLHTAGVVPNKLCDKTLGNVIIHDFAGQPEYYSSHTAVLESLLQNSGAVFVVVINLKQDLSRQVKFWSSIINNQYLKHSSECHLMVIASHADEITVTEELQDKLYQLERHILSELTGIGYSAATIFPLDCRVLDSIELYSLVEALSHLCKSIRNRQSPAISLYCNFLYSILEAKVSKDNMCTLENLVILCNQSKQEGVPLPDDIVPLLKTLHSSGLIVYLENKEDLVKSWVVVSKEILLSEVNGELFAPTDFVEHRDIASNTGIITSSALQWLFPHYPSNMLVAFLKSLMLCEELEKTLLKITNLKLKGSHTLDACDQLLFFPALITTKRPKHIEKCFKMGWCLKFTSGHSFSIRFLHILLLYLAYQYSQSVSDASPFLSQAPGLERQCSVWINGIHWYNDDRVETLVEQVEDNQCVMMLMSCQEGAEEAMVQLHCELTLKILHLQKTYCPTLQCEEFLLSSKLQYPLDKPSKMPRYNMERLRCRIRQEKGSIQCVDIIDQEATPISELLPIKPETYLDIYEVSYTL